MCVAVVSRVTQLPNFLLFEERHVRKQQTLHSRAAQNFWDFIPQTPIWKLAQTQNVNKFQFHPRSFYHGRRALKTTTRGHL